MPHRSSAFRLNLPIFTPRLLLTGILMVGLVVRLAFLARNWNNLEFDASFLLHAEVARGITNGNWFEVNQQYLESYVLQCRAEKRLIDPEDFPPPATEHLVPLYNDEGGYGMLLAATWKVFGAKRWWYIRVIQIVLDVVMCWMVFEVGRKAFSRTSGIIAGGLYAVFIPGIEMAVRPHRDIWVTFLFITSVYLLVRGGISSPPQARLPLARYALLAGAAGVVTWMRSTPVLFIPFLIVILALTTSWREAVRGGVVMAAVFSVLLAPLVIRNYSVFGKFMATRGSMWHSFWAGVGQMPNPYGLIDDDDAVVRFTHSIDSTVVYQTDAYELTLRRQAMELLRDRPIWYATTVVRRATLFVFPKLGRAVFFQPVPEEHKAGIINKSLAPAIPIVADVLLGGFFLAGLWMGRRRWKLLLLTGSPYFYTAITLAPIYITGRNIANVYYFVFLVGASAVEHILPDRFRKDSSPPPISPLSA